LSRDARAFPVLLAYLQGDNPGQAGDAARALGLLGRLEAEAPLISALQHQDDWVRWNACRGLAAIGSRNALPALNETANAPRQEGFYLVKEVAKQAIEQIEAREP
jgi:HEAT repeat protein